MVGKFDACGRVNHDIMAQIGHELFITDGQIYVRAARSPVGMIWWLTMLFGHCRKKVVGIKMFW